MLSVICFTVNITVMKHSYFFLFHARLDYPIYVAFNGSMTTNDLRVHDVIWSIIRNLTQLDCNSFIVSKCTKASYDNSLIKIDFTFN